MSESALYRKHHEGLERTAGEINAAPGGSPTTIYNALSRLTNLLKTHLTMEGKMTYPRMLAHSSLTVREMASARIHLENENRTR